ncbi:F-box family protein [Trifolium pratense]|uniref:F-box family protein n=1 Tax=Trifolium pratense TaxID=57577 RepID=A0A2K3L336_TRIPR|nr:F-box family protein [Trifolium pratense]
MSKSVNEVIMIPPEKRARRVDNNENQDRLSDLPDCVLFHILSYLDSKHAVQTCVLSTRWNHLWKRIPTLILHTTEFRTVKIFAIFVSNILTLRDTSTALHTLDLYRHGDIEPRLLKIVLNYVSSHNTHIQKLGISVSADSILIMSCVSSCRALTSLELSLYSRGSDNFTKTIFPKSLNLPLLTSLYLENFAFCSGENGCADPFTTLPKLNSLAICRCSVKDAQILSISSETLVSLAMRYNSSDFDKIELSTPSLRTFTFTGKLIQKICGSGLSFVKLVNIDDYSDSVDHALVLFSWLEDLANIESLRVTSNTLQILSLVPDLLELKLPSFCNLKTLEVELSPLSYGSIYIYIENAMLKKAVAKSRKEAAKLRKAIKAGLKPPPIPEGIVDFLRQNSPSAEVNIKTNHTGYFNLKQAIEESIKGAKITEYRSQFAVPASSTAPTYAAAPDSAAAPSTAAPPNFHLCPAEKVTVIPHMHFDGFSLSLCY